MSWMGCNAGEDISQPSLRIDSIHLGRDDQTVHGCGASFAAIGSAEDGYLLRSAVFGGPRIRLAHAAVRVESG
jgi:hypothetical protein